MIDFKKEIQKYRPAHTLDDLREGIVTGDITDIGDFLKYMLEPEHNLREQRNGPEKQRGKKHGANKLD